MTFVYPSSDLDRSRNLLAVLGSFWARTYTRRDQVRSYVDGTALFVAQSHRNLLEVVSALSRYDVPLYHTELWAPLVLRKSQRNSAATNLPRFDRTSEVFNGKLVFDTAVNQPYYAFPKPEKLAGAGHIFNKLAAPTLALAENVDYVFDAERNAVTFIEDPFSRPDVPKRGIYENGQLTDEEITLWAFQGQFDFDYVYNQFAYALGMKLRTSQGAKDLMNAVFNGLVNGGATAADLDLALSAITGVPLAREDETIEVMQRDAHGALIISDKNVYRFPEDVTPLVTVGQRVRPGTALVDSVQIVELTSGEIPASIPALALDKGFLSACFYGDLVFENRDVPLEIDTAHRSGYTYVKFGLGGFPADVAQFFDELHVRGIALAEQVPDPCDRQTQRRGTLAHMLDRRVNPAGEPNQTHLPTTINPLAFITANILRNNVFLVRIKSATLGQNRLGLYNMRHLRQLLPPQSAMIVIYEISGIRDGIDGAENLTEDVTTFTGMEERLDVVTEELVYDAGATARTLSGTCQ
jgi:hypothetical protein